MSLLQMKNICKSFSGVPVLKNVQLTVEKGEVHALLGENGAGKSTLVNMISGVARPTAGQIRLDGRDVTGLSVRHRARAGNVAAELVTQRRQQPAGESVPVTRAETLVQRRGLRRTLQVRHVADTDRRAHV